MCPLFGSLTIVTRDRLEAVCLGNHSITLCIDCRSLWRLDGLCQRQASRLEFMSYAVTEVLAAVVFGTGVSGIVQAEPSAIERARV